MFGFGMDVNWLKEDLERTINREKESYVQGLKKEEEFLEFINKLKNLRNWLDRKIEELEAIAPKVTKATTTKQLSAHEYITVAIAQKPNAPERIKKEAEEIIERYNLTPEEVENIYRSIFE